MIPRQRHTRGVGDVDGGGPGLDDLLQQTVQESRLRPAKESGWLLPPCINTLANSPLSANLFSSQFDLMVDCTNVLRTCVCRRPGSTGTRMSSDRDPFTQGMHGGCTRHRSLLPPLPPFPPPPASPPARLSVCCNPGSLTGWHPLGKTQCPHSPKPPAPSMPQLRS